MRVTRTLELLISQGSYENVKTSATIEFDTAEEGLTTAEEAQEFADNYLAVLLKPDVEVATDTSNNNESFAHDWKDYL